MIFEENPFHVLQVSIYDTKAKIIERARDILLNPRKNALYSELTAEEIRAQINAARAKAKFPAVQDTAAIKSELKSIRYEIREKFQAHLKEMPRVECMKFANDLAEILTHDEENFGIIIEDFFECCRLEMNSFLDETSEKIFAPGNFKFAFKAEFSQFLYELEPELKSFVNAIKPLDKFSIAIGTND